MGKISRRLFLGLVSIAGAGLGAYYYKNPKEIKKHKELLKNNVDKLINSVEKKDFDINKENISSTVEYVKLEAKEKLDDLIKLFDNKKETITEKTEEVTESVKDNVVEIENEVEEQIEEVKNETEFLEVAENVQEEQKSDEEATEEKTEEIIETLEDDATEKQIAVEKIKQEIENNKLEKTNNNQEEIKKDAKNSLDSIVSLFSKEK